MSPLLAKMVKILLLSVGPHGAFQMEGNLPIAWLLTALSAFISKIFCRFISTLAQARRSIVLTAISSTRKTNHKL